jgi:hypothetical protein
MRLRGARTILLLALAVLAGCKPAARGQCTTDAQCRTGAYCSTGGICLPDSTRPTVTVFVPVASDAVNGWVPLTSGNLEVRATVVDGTGGAVKSATLSFDLCPSAAACTYAGTVLSQANGTTVYSFTVPRSVQAAGSEAPLAVTVTAQDVAGDQGNGASVLQIDDAPPTVGALKLISAGVVGEDGKTWFMGDNGAAPVEVSVPVTDNGAGFGSLKLHLDPADLYGGFPAGSLDVTGMPAADGVHFLLPASGVRGHEQHLRFTLTASDLLLHPVTIGPDDPRTMIWVDALPPVIAFAPRVDYTSASGVNPQCATPDSSTYKCGRQSSSHLLVDDTATVSFDVYDCGVGIIPGQPDASVRTNAGAAHAAPVSQIAMDGAPCSGSTNKTHHYRFTINLASQAPVLDPPDPTGTTLVQLVANAVDGLQQTSSRGAPGSAITGDGLALVSLWRWRNQVAGAISQASGSPALIPRSTAGARQIAVGTTLVGSGSNLFVLNADGSLSWSAQVSPGVGGDVAAGPTGKLYAGSPAASCTTPCGATFNIIIAPTSGSTGAVHACTSASNSSLTNVSFGAPPAIVAGPERAVVAATAHSGLTTNNIFIFEDTGSCVLDSSTSVGVNTDYRGITANWSTPSTIFLSTAQGFSSADWSGSGFGAAAAYNTLTATVPTQSPPAVAALSTVHAFFGSVASDNKVRGAVPSTCVATACWIDDSTFPSAQAGNPVPSTPVFDSMAVYAADDHAMIYAFPRSAGGPSWSTKDFVHPSPALPSPPWPPAPASGTSSAPVLLQGQAVLLVRNDGVVALASSSGIAPLLMVKPLAAPVSPVVDTRGSGSVAYLVDGEGWVTALQIAVPPLLAGPNVWPRPGRDSCNSRNAASSCQ